MAHEMYETIRISDKSNATILFMGTSVTRERELILLVVIIFTFMRLAEAKISAFCSANWSPLVEFTLASIFRLETQERSLPTTHAAECKTA
jgi:hypothetical protein